MLSKIFGSKKEEKEEADIDCDEDFEEINSEENNKKIFDNIFKNNIFSNKHFSVYICSARDVCINIPIWSSNRPVDINHVNNISKDVETENHIVGSFKIITDGKNFCIFDGQHRYFALKNIFQKDLKLDIDILVEVYKVDNFDDSRSLSLFGKANTVKNIEIKDLPNLIAHDTIRILNEKFPNVFINSSKRVNRPKINKQQFYQKLKKILEENSNKTTHTFPKTTEDLVKAIEMKNIQYSLRPIKSYKQTSTGLYQKAKDLQFYLGLEKNIEDWLNELV